MPGHFLTVHKEFVDGIRRLILREYNLLSALAAARLYGRIRWVNFDGIYADEELERLLTERVARHVGAKLAVCKDSMGDGVVLLATALADQGGHSAVVKKWLSMLAPAMTHTLVVTRSITTACVEEIKLTGARFIECEGDELAKIETILRAASGANIVVLHIDPDDVAAAIAARLLRNIGYFCIFYNHADHVFSYGIGAADVVCEISEFGKAINRRSKRVLGKSIYLGVPLLVQTSQFDPVLDSNSMSKPLILTCGAAYKYKPAGKLFFGDFVDELLLLKPDAEVVVVGSTGQEPWWAGRLETWGAQVRFTGELASAEYESWLEAADVYVDSYPVTGGTAFPEALLNGKACAALANPCQGYSYADELRVDTVQQLAQRVNALIQGDHVELARLTRVREKVVSAQAGVTFKSKIERIYKRDLLVDADKEDSAKYRTYDSYWFEKVWMDQRTIVLPYVQKVSLSISVRFKLIHQLVQSCLYCKPRQFMSIIRAILKN